MVAQRVVPSEGVPIMAGAVIQTGCTTVRNCLINKFSALDHDCCLADHDYLASGAVVYGGVPFGQNSHIGAGATIIRGVKL